MCGPASRLAGAASGGVRSRESRTAALLQRRSGTVRRRTEWEDRRALREDVTEAEDDRTRRHCRTAEGLLQPDDGRQLRGADRHGGSWPTRPASRIW